MSQLALRAPEQAGLPRARMANPYDSLFLLGACNPKVGKLPGSLFFPHILYSYFPLSHSLGSKSSTQSASSEHMY